MNQKTVPGAGLRQVFYLAAFYTSGNNNE